MAVSLDGGVLLHTRAARSAQFDRLQKPCQKKMFDAAAVRTIPIRPSLLVRREKTIKRSSLVKPSIHNAGKWSKSISAFSSVKYSHFIYTVAQPNSVLLPSQASALI